MKSYESFKKVIFEKIIEYKQECVDLALELGANPEISGEEFRSSQKITDLLKQHGFFIQLPYSDIATAFKATCEFKDGRRNVGILVEYDALPEIGHGCGHNVSGAISILSALVLKELQEEMNINVNVIGTPREESDGAKCIMLEKKCFDSMEIATMIHMYDSNYIDPKFYAMDLFEYTFHGKASHSATAPWDGCNALNGAMLMFHAIDMLRQHVKPDARIHGVIRDGGKMPNIVPDVASCEIYIRSLERSYLDELTKKVDDCACGAAMATQTYYEKIKTGLANDNLKENEMGIQVLKEVYEELNIPIHNSEFRIFGSSDVGNVSMVCPTFQPTLQLVPNGVALHTKEFAKAACGEGVDNAVELGAKIISCQIAKIFSNQIVFEKMKEDFKKSL